MLGILINAALLCAIMYVIARHEADYSFPKVILISVGLALCNLVFSLLLGNLIALVLMLGLMAWALHHFCYLRWHMAATVTGIFLGCQLGLGIVIGLITQ